MPDINTPDAPSDQRLDVGSSTFSDPIGSRATKHLLTKELITTKGWALPELIKKSQNFHPVNRVHFKDRDLWQTIRRHEDFGAPLIVQGFHEHEGWPTHLFTLDWFNEHGKPLASARNVCNWSDFDLPLSDLIRKLRATQIHASEDETERLYGKDAECPPEWATWLSNSNVLPSDLLPHGTHDYLNYLPSDVQTLMCYLGVGDTYTPFHKDLCASSGQNLMCYTEGGGSSFWFMTTSSTAPHMAEYFHTIDKELDFESHVITLRELQESKLDIYIAEQQLGDLVLVPPRSCHQVINNGGITMKTSWSRMTLKGLVHSLYHELPIYHRVCRPETYKVKLNIYRALHHQTRTLQGLWEDQTSPTRSDQPSLDIESRLEKITSELHQLLDLMDDILGEEYSSKCQTMPHVSPSDISHQDNITCDFCGADVFQSFFECMSCAGQSSTIHEVGDGIAICPLCYVEGRSCKCRSMKPSQCRRFDDLLRTRDEALHAIQKVRPGTVESYQSLLDHPTSIISARHVGIFKAACALYERQTKLSGLTRMCSRNKTGSHEVSGGSSIYCPPCHSTRCQMHMLEIFHTHSSISILIAEGGNPSSWHEYHKKSKAMFKEARARILFDEETGARPELLTKLAYVASNFRICRSVNPNATLLGWYDISSELRGAFGGGPAMSSAVVKPSVTTRKPKDKNGKTVDSDWSAIHSVSMSDDDNASRPPKRQRVILPSDEPSGKTTLPLRLEKRASDGTVYITNKSRSFGGSLSDPTKKAVGIQVQVDDDAQAVLHKQLDLALAENIRLKATNNMLTQDIKDMEVEMCRLQEYHKRLGSIARHLHTRYSKMRSSYQVSQQGPFNPSSASTTLVVRHQAERHCQGTLTNNLAEATPTDPRVLEELLDRSPAPLGNQDQQTDHAFQNGVHCVAGPYHLIQDAPYHSYHQPEEEGTRKNTMQHTTILSEGIPSPEMLVDDPNEAQSRLGASASEIAFN